MEGQISPYASYGPQLGYSQLGHPQLGYPQLGYPPPSPIARRWHKFPISRVSLAILLLVLIENVQCGGVLIHPQWVLTAAHCLAEFPSKDAIVLLGVSSPEWPPSVTASEKILHPDYDSDNMYIHDIALLRLWPPVKLTDFIYPACLPPKTATPAYMSEECYISGLGSTRGSGDDYKAPDKLQQLHVSVMTDEACGRVPGIKDSRGGKTFRPVPARHICLEFNTTVRSAGACVGDSGGPLSCKYDGRFYVMGIAHYLEKGCKKYRFPDLFTRVSFYKDWIDSTMGKFSL